MTLYRLFIWFIWYYLAPPPLEHRLCEGRKPFSLLHHNPAPKAMPDIQWALSESLVNDSINERAPNRYLDLECLDFLEKAF